MLQAFVDTIHSLTGALPDIEQLIESFDTMWSIGCDNANEGEDGDMDLAHFKKEGGMWELLVGSGLLPAISPAATAAVASSSSYGDNMLSGSGVGSGFNYDYETPRSIRVIW